MNLPSDYTRENLDDNWMVNSTHDANRYLGAALKHFTSGIKALADYAHARGFKLNIYVGC